LAEDANASLFVDSLNVLNQLTPWSSVLFEKLVVNVLNSWKNYFCQILYAHGFNDVRLTKIHTAEPILSTVLSG
jgi:hypothetical protein